MDARQDVVRAPVHPSTPNPIMRFKGRLVFFPQTLPVGAILEDISTLMIFRLWRATWRTAKHWRTCRDWRRTGRQLLALDGSNGCSWCVWLLLALDGSNGLRSSALSTSKLRIMGSFCSRHLLKQRRHSKRDKDKSECERMSTLESKKRVFPNLLRVDMGGFPSLGVSLSARKVL